MKIARILALSTVALVALAAPACSSSTPSGSNGTSGTGTTDRGVEGNGEGTAAEAPDTNPAGVPYPTENLGTTVGTRVMNYKFLGYPDGDPSKGLQPMSLAQFFDPQGAKYKMIHVQASGTWCTFCRQETKVVTPMAQKLAERKVVWIISLAEGAALGTPATKSDLDQWIAQFKSPFPHFLDSGNKNFGPFYDAAALPWNANIDATTMKILSSGVGARTTEKDILAEIEENLEKVGQ